MTRPRPRMLTEGTVVDVAGVTHTIVRRGGTEDRPIVRLSGIEDRTTVESIRGEELTVDREHAPPLEESEWWAGDLEGCEVTDGVKMIGVVRALIELPSCEALEVDRGGHAGAEDGKRREGGAVLLVPMVKDAIRSIDIACKRVDVDMSFVEGE